MIMALTLTTLSRISPFCRTLLNKITLENITSYHRTKHITFIHISYYDIFTIQLLVAKSFMLPLDMSMQITLME